MGFLKKLFSVSDDNSDVEFDDIDRPTEQPASTNATTVDAPADGEMPEELLDAILGVINAQLPPIANQCLDRDAQRRYLASTLGESLTDYSAVLRAKAVKELTGDRAKMQSELEELRAERKEMATRRDEQKATLLSEQRQRRALSDRNRDLEAKINELVSEIEQHQLTISSLTNKMRVAEVTENDAASLREELASLRAQLADKDTQLAEKDSQLAAKDEEITSLSEKIADMESGSAIDAALERRREATGEATTEENTPEASAPKRRRGRPRKQTAYDPANDAAADIDSVDWLLPGGVPSGHTAASADPDFGYQPPKHAPEPDPDVQLTLF